MIQAAECAALFRPTQLSGGFSHYQPDDCQLPHGVFAMLSRCAVITGGLAASITLDAGRDAVPAPSHQLLLVVSL